MKHCFKNQLIVLPKGGDIVDVIAGKKGLFSDINLWRLRHQEFNPKQKFSGDKGYVGEEAIRTPQKKPKNGELSSEQKEKNRQISSLRIFVEHIIGVLKIFRVAQERFRLKVEKYKSVIETIAGLVRLRIGALILDVVECRDRLGEFEIIQRHLWSDFLTEEPPQPC